MKSSFLYGEDHLTARKALQIARGELTGVISQNCQKKVEQSRIIVEEISKGKEAVYGINTGFGPLCSTCLLYTSPSPRDRG